MALDWTRQELADANFALAGGSCASFGVQPCGGIFCY